MGQQPSKEKKNERKGCEGQKIIKKEKKSAEQLLLLLSSRTSHCFNQSFVYFHSVFSSFPFCCVPPSFLFRIRPEWWWCCLPFSQMKVLILIPFFYRMVRFSVHHWNEFSFSFAIILSSHSFMWCIPFILFLHDFYFFIWWSCCRNSWWSHSCCIVPIAPDKESLIVLLNSTSVKLDLNSWRSGGCPIKSYSVKYKEQQETMWTIISNQIDPTNFLTVIDGLHPQSWYFLIVSASSDAGTSEAEYSFLTPAFRVEQKSQYQLIFTTFPPFPSFILV